ncbi:MAG: hypothetical protein HXS48_05060 [Theionarchaea archaeon]|nr:hypothetical protein [Theionarchaea archaeon]
MSMDTKKMHPTEVSLYAKSMHINFEQIYKWFTGRIYPDQDCGKTVCGIHACCYPCHSHDKPTYLYYLPGELEFLKMKLKERFPAREIEPGSGKYHCFGNAQCVYEYRPIDCRSYPYWPVVECGKLVAFIDDRKPRCPIEKVPPPFFEKVKEGWLKLLKIPLVTTWLEFEGPQPCGELVFIKDSDSQSTAET